MCSIFQQNKIAPDLVKSFARDCWWRTDLVLEVREAAVSLVDLLQQLLLSGDQLHIPRGEGGGRCWG